MVHGNRHPELFPINRLLGEITEELLHHLMKEEQIAFPFLKAFEEEGKGATQLFPYGGFQNGPQKVLLGDHDATGEQLRDLRRLTKDYTAPADACITFRAFYQGLAELEADLHQHIHLENNVLFPMAERIAKGL
jgi:regulator of cell morphogenesis and NO signaling